jgi:sugar/nucleoside kinase (ribokinase family)
MVGPSIGRAARKPRLLVVGAAARDITPADPRGWRLGGGVTYGALAAARLGLHVRALVGADDEAAGAAELAILEQAGVEVRLVRLGRGPVMENRDTPAGRIQLVAQASQRITPDALPARWRSAPAVLLAPVAAELAPAWSGNLPRSSLVALGWQGMLRRLVPGREMVRLPLRRGSLIARADIALVSADDVAAGGAALRDVLRREGQQLVITHAARGALHLVRRGGRLEQRTVPSLPARHVADSTGAGDVFLAAWFAALLATQQTATRRTDWRALAVATAAASLSVEVSELAALPDLRSLCGRLRQARTNALSREDVAGA